VRFPSQEKEEEKLEGLRKERALAKQRGRRRKYYAVFRGVRGFTGVVNTAEEARELTEGVEGAKSKTCDTPEAARRYIDFLLRNRGAGWQLADLEAAAAAPIEVEGNAEEKAAPAEEAEEAKERFGAGFWEEVEARLGEQAAESIVTVCEIVAENDICEVRDADVVLKLLRVAGLAEEQQ